MIHRVKYGVGNLRTGCIIKEDEARRAGQRGKISANGVNRKGRIRCAGDFGVENILGFDLQILLLVTSEKPAIESCKMTSAKPILRCNNSST